LNLNVLVAVARDLGELQFTFWTLREGHEIALQKGAGGAARGEEGGIP